MSSARTEIGEYIVGAYLKHIEKCDFVDYNVRPPGGGLQGLKEIDVLGLRFQDDTAFLCEVTTHIRGLQYGKGYQDTIKRVSKKFNHLKQYSRSYLHKFSTYRFMFWSPVVPRGYLTNKLSSLKDLDLIINDRYRECIKKLQEQAEKVKSDTGNPFFRVLQILASIGNKGQLSNKKLRGWL